MDEQKPTFSPAVDELQPRQEVSLPDPSRPDKPDKSGGKKKVFFSLLFLILIAGFGYTTYSWMDEKDKNNQLNNQVSSVKNELDTAKAAQTTADAKDKIPENTVFKTDLSRFTLTLPKELGVSVERDGGGEGRPFTSLKVGEITANGVVSVSEFDDRAVYASPYLSGENFNRVLSQNLEEGAKKSPEKMKVDGVDAQVYVIGSMQGEGRAYYFEKNNIFYSIILRSNEASDKQFIKQLTDGFAFN